MTSEHAEQSALFKWADLMRIKHPEHFHSVDGRRADFNSGAPIALVAYGADNLDTLGRSRLGFVVVGHNAAAKAPERSDGRS